MKWLAIARDRCNESSLLVLHISVVPKQKEERTALAEKKSGNRQNVQMND